MRELENCIQESINLY
uniref:Uncharacterized protein n=1 Tax=Lepeophtheirus salmonis TaxID=72036 RepID=A0A0K2V6K4_LEPSM